MMANNNIQGLLKLCKYAGGRFDLVQAGGGNAGIKIDNNRMLVSQGIGCVLSETELNYGYVCVDTHKILEILEKEDLVQGNSLKDSVKIANTAVREANESPEIKPTAEVFLHALLPFKYTLHLHPVIINALLIMSDARDIISDLFPEAGFVEYGAPGLEVSVMFAQYMKQLSENKNSTPHLYFMKSHGIMVGHDSLEGLITIVEDMLDTAEAYCGVANTHFRNATKIADLYSEITGKLCVAHCSNDRVVHQIYRDDKEAFFFNPSYPDQYVYNAVMPLELKDLSVREIEEFKEKNNDLLPRVIVYQGAVYFISTNLKIAQEMEDVFKSHLLIISINKKNRDKIDVLNDSLKNIFFLASPL